MTVKSRTARKLKWQFPNASCRHRKIHFCTQVIERDPMVTSLKQGWALPAVWHWAWKWNPTSNECLDNWRPVKIEEVWLCCTKISAQSSQWSYKGTLECTNFNALHMTRSFWRNSHRKLGEGAVQLRRHVSFSTSFLPDAPEVDWAPLRG